MTALTIIIGLWLTSAVVIIELADRRKFDEP